MKKITVKLTLALALLLLFACGGYALSAGDSLVSLSYLKTTFFADAIVAADKADIEAQKTTLDLAEKKLSAAQKDALGGEYGADGTLHYSDTFQAKAFGKGDELTVSTGSSVLMLEGTVTLEHGGAVVDVTDGTQLPASSNLKPNHRYVVAENTSAQVFVSSDIAKLGIQGVYQEKAQAKPELLFEDVTQKDWFYLPVKFVCEKQLFSGVDETHFAPNGAMNRAMLMTVIYRLAGSPEGELAAANVQFTDVAPDAWYAPYVKWGAAKGITAGISADAFGPELNVTREQVVVLLRSFLENYLKKNVSAQGVDLSSYQDINDVSEWAKPALAWAVSKGLVGSTSTQALTLSPKKNATRAETATMLQAFVEKII